jgi:hypothetical protein
LGQPQILFGNFVPFNQHYCFNSNVFSKTISIIKFNKITL